MRTRTFLEPASDCIRRLELSALGTGDLAREKLLSYVCARTPHFFGGKRGRFRATESGRVTQDGTDATRFHQKRNQFRTGRKPRGRHLTPQEKISPAGARLLDANTPPPPRQVLAITSSARGGRWHRGGPQGLGDRGRGLPDRWTPVSSTSSTSNAPSGHAALMPFRRQMWGGDHRFRQPGAAARFCANPIFDTGVPGISNRARLRPASSRRAPRPRDQ